MLLSVLSSKVRLPDLGTKSVPWHWRETLSIYIARSGHVPGEMRPSYASLCSVSNVSFFRKSDKHFSSASAIINLSMVSIVDSLLSTLLASANRILRCEANAYFIGSGYAAVPLFFSRAAALVSRVSQLRPSTLKRACTPLTKSEEKERLLEV